MEVMKRFWSWLTSKNSRRPPKGHPDLYPIDIKRIETELQIAEEARRLGAASLPSSDAIALTGTESKIVQVVEKSRQDYVDWASLRLSVLTQNLNKIDITKDVNHARQVDQEFERKASAHLSEHESVLRATGETAKKLSAELNEFRLKHRLTREAHYPSSSKRFFLHALLAFVVVCEGILNASFFSQGLDSGLIGGMLYAMLLAGMNVGVGYLLGRYPIRYVFHINPYFKSLGIASIVVAGVAITSAGLGIAHFRDALTAEMANPAEAALTAFTTHTFHLHDFLSWMLFSVSVIFGSFSVFDGLLIDDKYPEYGAIVRRTLIAVEDHEEELASLRNDLDAMKSEALQNLDQALVSIQGDLALLDTHIKDKHTTGLRLKNALLDADNSLDALLHTFRTENQIARNGVACPGYFNTRPELRAITMPDFTTASEEASFKVQQVSVDALLAEVQVIRARIQAGFNQHYDRLKPLDTHFPMQKAA
jgi:hypothetical protein